MTDEEPKPLRVTLESSEMIAEQILVELSNKDKVALVLDRNGLTAIIDALENTHLPTAKQTSMWKDLVILRSAAFGGRKR